MRLIRVTVFLIYKQLHHMAVMGRHEACGLDAGVFCFAEADDFKT